MRNVEDLSSVVVHCSGSDLPVDDNIWAIRALHQMKPDQAVPFNGQILPGRGWADVGYNYIITQDGEVHQGRDLLIPGAHCRHQGQNRTSISICLTGEYYFSEAQKKALNNLITELSVFYNIDVGEVYPHSYFNSNKTCPNFALKEVYRWTSYPNRPNPNLQKTLQ